jgi:hypothetical protein
MHRIPITYLRNTILQNYSLVVIFIFFTNKLLDGTDPLLLPFLLVKILKFEAGVKS